MDAPDPWYCCRRKHCRRNSKYTVLQDADAAVAACYNAVAKVVHNLTMGTLLRVKIPTHGLSERTVRDVYADTWKKHTALNGALLLGGELWLFVMVCSTRKNPVQGVLALCKSVRTVRKVALSDGVLRSSDGF